MTIAEKKIRPVCGRCRFKHCEGLYWKEAVVLSDSSQAPRDCPLIMKNEFFARSALSSLCDFDVSRIAAEVWIRHNVGPRYVGRGHKSDGIKHIISHFNRGQCVILCKSVDPSYKPWLLFGQWGHGGCDLQPAKGPKEDTYLTDSIEVGSAERLPLRITGVSRDKKSGQCPIDVAVSAIGGVCIHIRDEKSILIPNIRVVLTSNDEEIHSGTLADGMLEISGIEESELTLECEGEGRKGKQPVDWMPGEAPYMVQTITVETAGTSGEKK